MRAQLILFILFLVAACTIGFSFFASTPPDDAALDFLAKLKQGNFREVVACFGDNTCNCPPLGGFKSYIRYESGLEYNIACLLGTPFEIGKLKVREIPDNQPYVVPWERPQSCYVDVPLTFPSQKLVFLPLGLAFGQNSKQDEFKAFLADPAKDAARGFALRLRQSARPGIVGKPDQIPAKPGVPAPKVLYPADCASVLLAQGGAQSWQTTEAQLPKLFSGELRLKVVRRGYTSPWKIAKCKFEAASLQVGAKIVPLTLKRPESPDLDL